MRHQPYARFYGLALAVLMYCSGAIAQERNLAVQSPKPTVSRFALVIGNDSYTRVRKLDNARADARAMARALEQVGFDVTLRLDLSDKAMREAVRTFKSRLAGGNEAVFYFAGHGVQLGSANYLLPIDIVADNEEQVRDDGLPLQRVLDDLTEQKVRFSLVIIDACRDNPFPRVAGRSIGTPRGLAPTTAATGQMVIYSAGTGQTALDRLNQTDRNPNGLFTRVFLREMQKPGLPVDRVLRNVRDRVVAMAKSVGHAQVPALYDQAIGEFYFRPPTSEAQVATIAPAPPVAQKFDPQAIELELWSSVKDSKSADELKVYLDQYPKGRFAALARARMKTLAPASKPPAQVASTAPTILVPHAAVSGEPRHALVIGNSSYAGEARLRNPINDATDMAEALRDLGFHVTLLNDADMRQIRGAIRDFSQALKRGGVGLFYFAGHGISSKGRNYLLPVKADIKEEFDLEYQAVDTNVVLVGMEDARNQVNIVILDACRNNPFARSWRSGSSSGGLAQMSAPAGSFIAFATSPNSVTSEGTGRNGIFTKHLLANLRSGESDIERTFVRVTRSVAQETANRQVPWISASLTRAFQFKPSSSREPGAGAASGALGAAVAPQGSFFAFATSAGSTRW